MELSQPSQPVMPTIVALRGTSVPIGELEDGRRLAIKNTPSISARDTYTRVILISRVRLLVFYSLLISGLTPNIFIITYRKPRRR